MMPMAWRYEYIIVVPTNFIPLFMRFDDILSDNSDDVFVPSPLIMFPLVNPQIYSSNVPYYFWISIKILALLITALIFNLLRIMSGLFSNSLNFTSS